MTQKRILPLDNVMIRAEQVYRDFGEVRAVADLNLEVRRGEIFGLVGPDGAGKTTTLRMLAGILDPTSGNIWVNGILVNEDPDAIKEHIAYMPQRFGLYQDLSVLENLLFYADLFSVPHRERSGRLEKLFAFSRLGPFKDRPAGALSGGMKQKLALACALIHSPQLLLLDEPTNGVDPVSRRDFWRILYDLLKEGITILVSTAYLDEAERTTRVGLMHRGSIIQFGEPLYLKQLVPGVMMEVVTSDLTKTRSVLARTPGVFDVNVFGDGLHVRVSEEVTSDALQQAIANEGITVTSLRNIQPSMEDAFLGLIPNSST